MKLRPAGPDDAGTLLRWRNDPTTRSMSFDQSAVAPDDHQAWLAAKLADPRCEIWIGMVDERPVGQVRFDLVGHEVAIVSVSVDAAARGAGVGAALLAGALAETTLGASTMRALVRPGNAASLRLFERCAFRTTSTSLDEIALERTTGLRRP